MRRRLSVPDPLGKGRSASLRREAAPYACPSSKTVGVGGHDGPQTAIRLQFPDIPPELQGVSVKDLVKALGK